MRLLAILLVVALAALAAAPVAVVADEWVILVAGSTGYGNYRHQADVAHAYQIVKENGIPEENIITFVYNDIANNSRNPFPGQVFNEPTQIGTPGRDVWADMKIDYQGSMVSAKNFLNVLEGNSSSLPPNSKVVNSGPDDRIFIFYSDHGAPGFVEMPNGPLYASAMIPTLQRMHENKKFARMVFYLEACESGSMFAGLLNPAWNIYATTASDPYESSWGTYCPPNDMINGKHIGSCLGDLYSVNWMQDTEKSGMKETLQEQYQVVKKLTDKSKVMQYGSMEFTSAPTGEFMGDKGGKLVDILSNQRHSRKQKGDVSVGSSTESASRVSTRDIPMHLAYYRYLRAEVGSEESTQALAELRAQLDSREAALNRFQKLAHMFAHNEAGELVHTPFHYFNAPATPIISGLCVQSAFDALKENGCAYDDFSLQFHKVIVNACDQYWGNEEAGTRFVVKQIQKVCAEEQK